MMREIVLDTETTGLDPEDGHRVVEIACLELVNHVPTGTEYHTYVNPQRDMPTSAFEIHGLSAEFLGAHPVFADVADDFLGFISDDPLVIHNADFDLRFLNAELGRLERPQIPASRAIDTVLMARRKFPGAQASLDALCRRFEIDLSVREKHGALIDVALLARVYLELIGGAQPTLGLTERSAPAEATPAWTGTVQGSRTSHAPRPHAPTDAERAAHEALLAEIVDPIWRR